MFKFENGTCGDRWNLATCHNGQGNYQFSNLITWVYAKQDYYKIYNFNSDDSLSISIWRKCGDPFNEFNCELNHYHQSDFGTGQWNLSFKQGWNVVEFMGFNDEGPATYNYNTYNGYFSNDPMIIAMNSDGAL